MTMTQIILDPLLPPFALIALGVMLLGMTLWSVLKGSRTVWLRLAAGALILASLANPQVTRQDSHTQKDIALVLIDQSGSQSLGGRTRQTQQAVERLKAEAAHHADLELRFIDLPADAREDTAGTRVFQHLKQVLAGIAPDRYAGAVLISDGQIHDVEDAQGLPGPFHLLLSGSKNDHDRRIDIVNAPRYAIVGKPVMLRLRVLDNGQVNESAPLYLRLQDGTRQKFTPGEDGIQETVYIADHAGSHVLLAETPTLEGELSPTNNKIALNINGVRDRLRVLLVSGQPHQGQRTWRNILRSDPSVDLVHFTILRPSEKEDYTPLNELSLIAFPVRELFEEKLDDFDLIIFDRYYQHNVLNDGYFNNIVQYVRKGGALLVSTGPDFIGTRSLINTPLRNILPIEPSGIIQDNAPFRIQKSNLGQRHPVTTRLDRPEKSWGRWMRLIETRRNTGQTLLQSDHGEPILVVEREQKGRIAMLLSDHVWLWARGFDGGGPHGALVRNLVHWLMKEPELEENSLRLSQQNENTLMIHRQSLSNDNPPVTLTHPDGRQQSIKLTKDGNGEFSAPVTAPAMGIYEARDTTHRTTLIKGSLNPKELEDPRASADVLTPFIEEHDGSIHWLEDGIPLLKRVTEKSSKGGKDWIGLPRRQHEKVIGIKHSPLLPIWLVFISASLLWGLAWWRESR